MSYLPLPYITSSSRRRRDTVIVILFSTRENESRRAAAGIARQHVYRGERLRYRGADVHVGGTMHTYAVV